MIARTSGLFASYSDVWVVDGIPTVVRELWRGGLRYGVSGACIGSGQGIALLVKNPQATKQ